MATPIQTSILCASILSCILAIVIFFKRQAWKYYAVMLFFVNLVNIFYYIAIIYFDVPGHLLSQVRSFLQVLTWLMFSITLIDWGSHDE